ncbi:MAG: S-methyl-5'-thioadenosine phosphorylase [Dehalococcoidia bacterium]
MAEAKFGIIAGSGFYEMDGLTNTDEVNVKTPFGEPSDAIIIGNLEGVPVAFLPRHGRGHRISPTDIPARANIYAMKTLGVERIISVAAVGSLNEKIKPLDLVIPDQIIDRTRNRGDSFFNGGIVAHIMFAEPYCPETSRILYESAKNMDVTVHEGGTCIAMEGPQFSTKAESNMYRSWGADIIGMTALPEAKLAREAEICYAGLSFVTDFDCWYDAEETVTVEMILDNLNKSIDKAKMIVRKAVRLMPQSRECSCAHALDNCIITTPGLIPPQIKKDLAPIIGKYIS